MKFSAVYRLDSHDVDLNGCASASSVLRLAQETANLQHETYGPKTKDLRDEGKAFVLSRLSLDILYPLYAQDSISVQTWLNEARGYGFLRNTVYKRGDLTVAEMTATWGIIDLANRAPLKIEERFARFGTDEDTLKTQIPLRFRFPKDKEPVHIGKRKVMYSDCDENRHMNNTKYPCVFCDMLEDMSGIRVNGISLSFMHEAMLGSSFDIFHVKDSSGDYFRTVLENGNIGTEAVMSFGTDI